MRKILCIVISMFILMSISNAGLAIGINADSEITGPIEEKVFCNARPLKVLKFLSVQHLWDIELQKVLHFV